MTDDNRHTGIALDVGGRRIGVARASLIARLACPLTTLKSPETFLADIVSLVRSENAAWIVIGLPRGLEGQETAQTSEVRGFAKELETLLEAQGVNVPIYWTDEALTSSQAEAELSKRTRDGVFDKADVDALAATYILEDFLKEHNK